MSFRHTSPTLSNSLPKNHALRGFSYGLLQDAGQHRDQIMKQLNELQNQNQTCNQQPELVC